MAITAETVRSKTNEELRGALRDIEATLEHADALDRAEHTSKHGGKYRDEAALIHAEISRRAIRNAHGTGVVPSSWSDMAEKAAVEALEWEFARTGREWSDQDLKAARAGAGAMLHALVLAGVCKIDAK